MEDSREQKVKDLAKTLLDTGVVSGYDEARQRAEEMVEQVKTKSDTEDDKLPSQQDNIDVVEQEDSAPEVYDERIETAQKVEQAVEVVQEKIEQIEDDVDTIEEGEETLKETLRDMKEASSTAKTELSSLQDTAEKVETDIEQMERELDVASAGVKQEPNKEDIEAAFVKAKDRLDKLKVKIAEVEKEISGAQDNILNLSNAIEQSIRMERKSPDEPSYDVAEEDKTVEEITTDPAEQKADEVVRNFQNKDVTAEDLLKTATDDEDDDEQPAEEAAPQSDGVVEEKDGRKFIDLTRIFDYKKIRKD